MIVICQCQNAGLVSKAAYDKAVDIAQNTSRPVVCLDDLCAMASKKDPLLKQWAGESDLTVCACFPRAVRALFAHAGVELPDSTAYINLRTGDTEAIDSLAISEVSEQVTPTTIQASGPDWVPWFPVIDYDRCKNCKQCLNFCLFGVYSMTDEKVVEVLRPHKCKTGCPACARVCPHAAIIFPKYEKSPINGDEVIESEWKKSHTESAASLKHRLSGNVYQLLRDRNTPQATPQSLSDLEKLKDQFDIPDNLFDSHS